ncbi:MAG: hypothetical protein ACKVZ0_24855 [Gemmatimonadales bacterium]
MASLRKVAACIGITGSFSVVKRFYGYRSGVFGHKSLNLAPNQVTFNQVKIAPDDPGTLSLRRQIQLLKTRFINLDVIRVGGDVFTAAEQQEVDIAVQVARELYQRVDIGIGRVLAWHIKASDAGSYMSLDSRCETIDLIDEWTAPGGGIDCFFVRSLTYGPGGGTPEKGDGLVVVLLQTMYSGVALAHELGHYLGVDYHLGNRKFLMASSPVPPYRWRPEELDIVRNSESMRGGCQ